MRLKIAILFFLASSSVVNAATLFTSSFNSWDDWTVTQNVSSPESCYTGAPCGMGEDWRAYNLQGSLCGDITGRPGYNTHYVNSIAGYPSGSETCRSGSGKCLTHWMEGCMEYPNFDSTDANLGAYLGAEYDDVYLRFYIRFSSAFTIATLSGSDGSAFKLFHIQHWGNPAESSNPWSYFNYDTTNRPLTAGGILRYGDSIYFFIEGRCVDSYYCDQNEQIWYTLGTYDQQKSSGVLDGNWHSLIIRIKNNSEVGTADGLIEFWLDGTQKTAIVQDNFHPYNTYEFNDIAGDWRGWSFASVGGNNTEWGTAPCSSMGPGDCEQWYAIDSVKITTTLAEALSDSSTDQTVSGGIDFKGAELK